MKADARNRGALAFVARYANCAMFVVAMIGLTVSTSGAAQNSSQPVSPQGASAPETALTQRSDEKTADIRRLLELSHSESVLRQFVVQVMHSMKPMMIKSIPRNAISDELLDKVIEAMIQNLNARIDYGRFMDETMVPIYDKDFDDQQIKALIQFYESPAGQRLVAVQPQMMQESGAAGQQWFRDNITPLMPKVIEDTKAQFPELDKLP